MFSEIANTYNWDKIGDEINAKTKGDVEQALHTSFLTIEDFKALVSPSASII
jgi:hypothetical protein